MSKRSCLAFCDICDKPRAVGSHIKCSQIRKSSKADTLAIYQADQAAKRELRNRRYAR